VRNRSRTAEAWGWFVAVVSVLVPGWGGFPAIASLEASPTLPMQTLMKNNPARQDPVRKYFFVNMGHST
jgi:hypothetical protein